MSKTRLLALPNPTLGRRGLVAAIVALGVVMLAPSSAGALEVAVTWPDTATVGQTGQTGAHHADEHVDDIHRNDLRSRHRPLPRRGRRRL